MWPEDLQFVCWAWDAQPDFCRGHLFVGAALYPPCRSNYRISCGDWSFMFCDSGLVAGRHGSNGNDPTLVLFCNGNPRAGLYDYRNSRNFESTSVCSLKASARLQAPSFVCAS